MNSTVLGNAIVDHDTYATDDRYHQLFARLRREQPLAYASPDGHRPFWAVTKHADIRSIELQAEKFLNQGRVFLATIEDEMQLKAAQDAGLTSMGQTVVEVDGETHRKLRRITQGWFTPASIKTLEDKIRVVARESVDHMESFGGACDFVKDVSLWYPLRVIMLILGLPREDEDHLMKLTQAMFSPSDPDTESSDGALGMMEASQGIQKYFEAVTADRRRSPKDDVASVIANATIDGELISDRDATGYYVTIITAGHDTTSSTTACGMLALLQHPEELRKLRSGAASLPSAIDEFLRWGTPIKHFFRTAVEDCEIRGQQVKAGDSLMMCYPSANRDEEVFEDPFAFRVDRSPNPHIAFGYGPHVCLGQHLAKMEVRIFYEELLGRIDHMALAGDTALTRTNFIQGLKTLPITYSMRRRAA